MQNLTRMLGFYDGTIIHRIIKSFVIQGGDRSGTGKKGETVDGADLPDEFHTRLRFTRRGLVACADHRSQFFITLDKAGELAMKHSIFGRVVGDTIFNVLRIADLDTAEDERPISPPRFESVSVVWNPFEDIFPRDIYRTATSTKAVDAKQPARRKVPMKRDLKVLSFGDEAPDGIKATGIRASHDLLQSDRRLCVELAVDPNADIQLPVCFLWVEPSVSI